MRAAKIVGIILFASLFAPVYAAELYISPPSAAVRVGETFPVSINAASAGQSYNAVAGSISFPPDKLQAVSVSKSGSVVSLWAVEPTFSNANGTINFEGVIPNPGHQGAGKVVTVYFKPISTGSASVSFANGSILANDGNGTDIADSFGSATFSIAVAAVRPTQAAPSKPAATSTGAATSVPAIATTAAPVVSTGTEQVGARSYGMQLAIDVLALVSMLLFIALMLYGIYKVHSLGGSFAKRLLKTHDHVFKYFKRLEDDIDDLEKRRNHYLSEREASSLEHMKKDLAKTKSELMADLERLGKDHSKHSR